MPDISAWGSLLSLPPTALPVALACALCGAVVLSLYTPWLGVSTLLINVSAMVVGACLANVLFFNLMHGLERHFARPIVLAFLGMAAAALVVLWFARNDDIR